jgi:hypothetical protein
MQREASGRGEDVKAVDCMRQCPPSTHSTDDYESILFIP